MVNASKQNRYVVNLLTKKQYPKHKKLVKKVIAFGGDWLYRYVVSCED